MVRAGFGEAGTAEAERLGRSQAEAVERVFAVAEVAGVVVLMQRRNVHLVVVVRCGGIGLRASVMAVTRRLAHH